MPAKKKITGLFFGSFNPVHNGHLIIANYVKQFTGLDEVWFVVSPRNPLKNKSSLLDARQRLHMVNLAIGDCAWLKSSDIEFKLPKPSFTIHTLIHLREQFPKRIFAIIMGSDSMASITKWKNYEIILRDYMIFVYPRHSSEKHLYPELKNIEYVHAPRIEVSSSDIRKALHEGKDMRFYMPEPVFRYSDEMNFYR
jgi:nicotinate-nucleotide adenylyltransferase